MYAPEAPVYLIKVHRILIASGIALCMLYMVLQARRYTNSNATADLIRACIALALAAGLGFYFRSIRQK
jgi:hypothetical protein